MLNRWNSKPLFADTVIDYTANLLEDRDIVLISLILESNKLAAINSLLIDILAKIPSVEDLQSTLEEIKDSKELGKIGCCLIKYPVIAKQIIPLIANKTKPKRCAQFFPSANQNE